MNKKLMEQMGFGAQVQQVSEHLCPLCGAIVDETAFRDICSHEEYRISGLCQDCQDSVFGNE